MAAHRYIWARSPIFRAYRHSPELAFLGCCKPIPEAGGDPFPGETSRTVLPLSMKRRASPSRTRASPSERNPLRCRSGETTSRPERSINELAIDPDPRQAFTEFAGVAVSGRNDHFAGEIHVPCLRADQMRIKPSAGTLTKSMPSGVMSRPVASKARMPRSVSTRPIPSRAGVGLGVAGGNHQAAAPIAKAMAQFAPLVGHPTRVSPGKRYPPGSGRKPPPRAAST